MVGVSKLGRRLVVGHLGLSLGLGLGLGLWLGFLGPVGQDRAGVTFHDDWWIISGDASRVVWGTGIIVRVERQGFDVRGIVYCKIRIGADGGLEGNVELGPDCGFWPRGVAIRAAQTTFFLRRGPGILGERSAQIIGLHHFPVQRYATGRVIDPARGSVYQSGAA